MANQETVIIAVSSSIITFVLSSVAFFIFGYICGCKCKKTRTTGDTVSGGMEVTQPVQQQHIELSENLAYGHIYNMRTS